MDSDARAFCIIAALVTVLLGFSVGMCTDYNSKMAKLDAEIQQSCIEKGCSWTINYSPSGTAHEVCYCKGIDSCNSPR